MCRDTEIICALILFFEFQIVQVRSVVHILESHSVSIDIIWVSICIHLCGVLPNHAILAILDESGTVVTNLTATHARCRVCIVNVGLGHTESAIRVLHGSDVIVVELLVLELFSLSINLSSTSPFFISH